MFSVDYCFYTNSGRLSMENKEWIEHMFNELNTKYISAKPVQEEERKRDEA